MKTRRVSWPNRKRAVVSLTYDDGIVNHPMVVVPQLEQYGLSATFYAPLKSDVMQNPLCWRNMSKHGHEIGNHTVFHPCWSLKGKYSNWLPDEFNLEYYSEEQWLDEVKIANQVLFLIDGKSERTFGNTCWDNYLGPEENPVCLEPLIKKIFLGARGERTEKLVNMDPINFLNLGTISADGRVFKDFALELDELLAVGGWAIYTFHGIGKGSHTYFTDENEHNTLLKFLYDESERIWTAPVIDVVKFLRRQDGQLSFL